MRLVLAQSKSFGTRSGKNQIERFQHCGNLGFAVGNSREAFAPIENDVILAMKGFQRCGKVGVNNRNQRHRMSPFLHRRTQAAAFPLRPHPVHEAPRPGPHCRSAVRANRPQRLFEASAPRSGQWPVVSGWWVVISYQLSVVGYRLSVSGNEWSGAAHSHTATSMPPVISSS